MLPIGARARREGSQKADMAAARRQTEGVGGGGRRSTGSKKGAVAT